MPVIDPRIDAYIARSPDFAQPILSQLRAAIHAACPDVEDTMKWTTTPRSFSSEIAMLGALRPRPESDGGATIWRIAARYCANLVKPDA